MGTRHFIINLLVCLCFVLAIGSNESTIQAAEDDDPDKDASADTSTGSTASETPRRHFRMRQVVDLEPDEANRIYDLVSSALAKGYASSDFEGVDKYQTLTRYNNAPYLSSTHGNLYVNNYANQIADKYGGFEQAGQLPVGSIIFKDSFSVTEATQSFSGVSDSHQIILGPLFIMRKMEPGFNRVTGDWQYIQIQPDGEVIGMTGGEGAERVEYCISCHLAREVFDHLYFVPDSYRSKPQ